MGCIVISDQHAAPRQQRGAGIARLTVKRRWASRTEARGKPKGGPLADFTVQANVAAHQPHQLPADRQPQPGTAVAARGGAVSLAERLKHARLRLGGNTNTCVAYFKTQYVTVFALLKDAYRQRDFALLGKLQRIADQVGGHLANAVRIAVDQHRYLRRNMAQQLQFLGRCPLGQQLHHVLQRLAQIEINPVEFEFACLDLGKIENVVDDIQQGFARTPHGFREMPLPRVERCGQQQFRHAQNAVHRRADFMTHIGKELRLRQAGSFRQVLGLEQIILQTLALRHIQHGRHQTRGRAIGAREHRQIGAYP